MRIIAGKFKAKKIFSPLDIETRPTLDRVKESLFSVIGNDILNACVLDLFAGTANLSIESLSRDAKFVWINDISKKSIDIIIKNVRLTETQSCVKITRKDYEKCLMQVEKEEKLFDIIFVDPPYDFKATGKILQSIANKNILKENGKIYLETDKRKILDENIDGLVLKDKRIYGRVMIRIYVVGVK